MNLADLIDFHFGQLKFTQKTLVNVHFNTNNSIPIFIENFILSFFLCIVKAPSYEYVHILSVSLSYSKCLGILQKIAFINDKVGDYVIIFVYISIEYVLVK